MSHATTAPTPPTGERVASVDAYRGFVMLLMMAEVLHLGRVAKAFPESGFWTFLARQQTHVAWEGWTLHDLIQPSFSFLVGVALPFSLARRAAGGQPEWVRTLHAFWRALVLALLGVFLRSTHSQQTNWTFEDTLTQIGLGYATLSFLPTLGTMILGLFAGNLLRADLSPLRKVRRLVVAGMGCLAAGWLLGVTGVCPVVKRIWTPSWVLFSGGWCFLLLAGFYLVMDVRGWRRWAFALTVIGANSLAAYLIAHLVDGFLGDALDRHLGKGWAEFAGEGYAPLVHGAAVLLAEWLILFWMYRRKLFVRV